MLSAPLVLEALVLYVGLPLLFDRLLTHGARRLLVPALWVAAALAMAALAADPSFDTATLWSLPGDPARTRLIALRTGVGVALVGALSRRLSPGTFLWLPRMRPRLWLLVVTFYPLLSVLPQGVIFRVFFVHRYALVFGHGAALLAAGALAFAFAHVIFRNLVAVALTGIGGLLFLHTYLATGSMLLSSLEHAAYGVAAFTFGIGRSLYVGATRNASDGGRSALR